MSDGAVQTPVSDGSKKCLARSLVLLLLAGLLLPGRAAAKSCIRHACETMTRSLTGVFVGEVVVARPPALPDMDERLNSKELAIGRNGVTIVPSLHHAITGDGKFGLVRVNLRRPALRQGARFAACMAPVLSPGAQWIVCRNKHGDVLSTPIGGGRLTRFHRYKGTVYRGPQPAVAFPSKDSMDVATNITGDYDGVETVPWREVQKPIVR